MTRVLILALLLVGSNPGPTASAATISRQSSADENRQEAERLWESAIVAKGGRERLQAVENLQISIREKVWYGLRRIPYIDESLYVFPGKYWKWNDQKKSIFGLSLRMYNHERDLYFSYVDRGKGGHLARPIDWVHGKAGLIPLYDVQLRYFMETKWVKPIPVSVHKLKIDGKSVDVVQTIVKGYPTKDGKDEERIGFALNPKTHLPIRIVFYKVPFREEYSGGTPLSDYVVVDGIQMPSKVYGLRVSYQINVDYDEQIFIREPNIEAGIKQWSKK